MNMNSTLIPEDMRCLEGTFDEAVTHCARFGGRPCTSEELRNNCAVEESDLNYGKLFTKLLFFALLCNATSYSFFIFLFKKNTKTKQDIDSNKHIDSCKKTRTRLTLLA